MSSKIERFFRSYPDSSLADGEVILSPGEKLDFVRYIEKGRVIEYDLNHQGTKIILNVFRAGAFFPMSCAINNMPAEHYFGSDDNTVVRLAPVSEVLLFVHDNYDVLFDLLSRTYRGTDGVLRRLSSALTGDAIDRVAVELDILAQRFGYDLTPDSGRRLVRPLTITYLAELSGLSRETTSRTVSHMIERGKVTLDRKIFTLFY